MTPGERLVYRRLRAPRESGAALVEPPLASAGEVLAANLRLREQYACDLHGRSLPSLAAQARKELLAEALRHTSSYRDVAVPPHADRVLLAGHQPLLFHPGVWFKNFALSWLARRHAAVAVNLVIDSDTIKNAAIRVPTGTAEAPATREVAFDRQTAEIPFEERPIIDRETFSSFGRRAEAVIRPLVPNPLLAEFWPFAQGRSRHNGNLGECLAQARHQYEARQGLSTLELPQSGVCRLPAFHWFAAHLLAELPRLWQAYNAGVSEYRRVNRVRSANHPAPDLAAAGDWLEAPFWIWHAGDPRRRRLFVRRRPGELLLGDRAGCEIALPLSGGDLHAAAEALGDLPRRGIRLRTRALITTLWARLALGDLFLHGIGGAKYDQLTDVLFARLFGLTPPQVMVLSATIQLPVERRGAGGDELRRAAGALRELAFHPERFLEEAPPEAARLIAAKQALLGEAAVRSRQRAWCREVRGLNESLQPFVAGSRQRLLAERADLERRRRADALLGWREYAFCLYPADTLRKIMLAFFPDTA